MLCLACKCENPEDKKFCGKCGARLAARCPKCGTENPPDNRFCGDCGTTLISASPAKTRTVSSVGPFLAFLHCTLAGNRAPRFSKGSARPSRRCSPTSKGQWS